MKKWNLTINRLQFSDSRWNKFEGVCADLLGTIERGHRVNLEDLNLVSNQVRKVVSCNIIPSSHSSLDLLSHRLSDYMQIEFSDDKDILRKTSYARLQQLLQVAQQHMEDIESESRALELEGTSQPYRQILALISQNPGILDAELKKYVSADELRISLPQMEAKGLLLIFSSGEHSWYTLTKLGTKVNSYLNLNKGLFWAGHWSNIRIDLLSKLMLTTKEYGINCPVSFLLDLVKDISDEQVKAQYRNIIAEMKKPLLSQVVIPEGALTNTVNTTINTGSEADCSNIQKVVCR